MRQQNVEVLTHLFLKRFCASTSTRVVPHPMLRPSALDGVICWPGIFPFLSLSSLISWYIKFVSQCKFSTFQTLFLSLSLFTHKTCILNCEKWNLWLFHAFNDSLDFHPKEKSVISPCFVILVKGFLYFSCLYCSEYFSLVLFYSSRIFEVLCGICNFFFSFWGLGVPSLTTLLDLQETVHNREVDHQASSPYLWDMATCPSCRSSRVWWGLGFMLCTFSWTL